MGAQGTTSQKTPRERVLAELEAHNGNIRGFARKLAGADPKAVERWRRALNRYVHEGAEPTDEIAEEMAEALGRPADYFKAPRAGGARGKRDAELLALREELAELRGRLAAQDRQIRALRKAVRSRADEPPGGASASGDPGA